MVRSPGSCPGSSRLRPGPNSTAGFGSAGAPLAAARARPSSRASLSLGPRRGRRPLRASAHRSVLTFPAHRRDAAARLRRAARFRQVPARAPRRGRGGRGTDRGRPARRRPQHGGARGERRRTGTRGLAGPGRTARTALVLAPLVGVIAAVQLAQHHAWLALSVLVGLAVIVAVEPLARSLVALTTPDAPFAQR
jgi:hypothetical protein